MLKSIVTREKASWVSSRLLEFIFPRTCVNCGCLVVDERGGFTCRLCRSQLEWLAERNSQEGYYSLFKYKGVGARLVHALKYEGGLWLRREIEALLREAESIHSQFRGSVLVPVPLHRRRLRQRGYNQARIISEAIHSIVPEVIICDALRRVRMTPSQTFLTRKERLENMRNAFFCVSKPIAVQRVVLIDDVMTTGATLNAAESALRDAGVSNISAFTLAHG